MSNFQINKIVSVLVFGVAIYSVVIIFMDIGNVYQSGAHFFQDQSTIYPLAITILVAIVPLSISAIGYLVYIDKRTYFILLLLAHVLIVFSSYLVYAMCILLIYWWLLKYARETT